ncbi:MAG: histidine kinase [Bacteroidetes bacterium CG02_land_8_20_14_3_00_31_25]|nr:GAF domain-containing protein [Bacteroidota bacterium]OFX36151.1 MAG: histidine kinase [Bacteroidetes bacterium GWA2_32_17]PIV58369.1 MAG: histidine kinase [Bacteroidetes bacterium CG02_land_8_20_14_3_00_31_25]PIX32497.1 MAG: histidine kinase [Bacteroidetes bacterium CG_4_8_14_3_um_filter_31_14]PIY03185.1 MAG: histidine kinase [Bacteroidetes bacterium CG_4_10_14_3_um_filter_31_20]
MDKEKRYSHIIEQLDELLKVTEFPFSRMATIAALLYNKLEEVSWTGFYLKLQHELVVGPYQGPLACQKLKNATGVCWASFNQNKTIIVPDVHKFEGHIACDSRTNSEIVTPIYFRNGMISGVLDIDSKNFNNFDDIDAKCLEKLSKMVYV